MSNYLTSPRASKTMPKGIPYIIGNELAERFSFYGMKCILLVFMTKYLINSSGEYAVMDPNEATYWYHIFTSAVYFTPIFGAILSDAFLGKYKTILLLSIVYCLGHFALALDETRLGLTIGLTLIAIGAGGIKPCVSAHVGDQFGKTNSYLLEKVFSWFYLSINLGAFISTLLTPILLQKYGPHIAFGIPGILMLIATILFWMGRNVFIHIQPEDGIKHVKKFLLLETFKDTKLNITQIIVFISICIVFREIASLFFSDIISNLYTIFFLIIYLVIITHKDLLNNIQIIAKLSIIYLFVAIFWALFDQTGSTWVVQAEHLNRHWLGIHWLPSQIQAINPIMILIFAPTFAYFLYPKLNSWFDLTPIKKISIGLFIAVPSFIIIGNLQAQIDAGLTPSIAWQVLAYAILTASEVFVSITCLEFSYTQAPNSLKSFIMGFFLLSVSVGNIFTAGVNKFILNSDGTSNLEGASYFYFFSGIMLITALLFLIVVKYYKPKTYLHQEA